MNEEYEIERIAEGRYRIRRVSYLPTLLFLGTLTVLTASVFSNLTRPRSWDGKALDLVVQGKYQDALQIANQKLASHPKSQDDVSSAYFIQHDAYTGMGKTERAIQSLEQGLEIYREKHCFSPKKVRASEVDPICTADARELHRQMESLNLRR